MSAIHLTCARVLEKGPRGGIYVRFVLEEGQREIGRFKKRNQCQAAYSERARDLKRAFIEVKTFVRDWHGHWDGVKQPCD